MALRSKQILLALGTLLYILSPVDLVPDLLPGLGWLDDIVVLGLLLWFLSGMREGPRRGFEARAGEPKRGAETVDPHALLGVDRDASADEIRAAYRRLVAQYHPDKVSHLGKEFQEMAHQKLIEIQQAYETLMGRANAKGA
jgi:uncharacterized membrane protein YkvA (DUF1232 family)